WASLGRADTALETLDDALAELGSVVPLLQSTWARVRAQALMGSGRIEEARGEIQVGLQSAREHGLLYEEGLLILASVELDRAEGIDPAPETLAEVETRFRRLNVRWSAQSSDS